MQHIDLAGFLSHARLHPPGESATQPIEPHFGTLTALLRLGTEALAQSCGQEARRVQPKLSSLA